MKIRFLGIFLFPTILFAQQKDTLAMRYATLIKAETMREYLHVLASDEYEGRETAKKGQKMAAAYISEQFKKFGIPPYKENTYLQPFSIEQYRNTPIVTQVTTVTSKGNTFSSEKDYCLIPGRGQYELNFPTILFAGYGIDDKNYSNYKGISAENKVLMVLDGEPVLNDSTSLITGDKSRSEWTTFYKRKIERAYKSGATALLIVSENFEKDLEANKTKLPFIRTEKGRVELPVFYISKSMANALLRKTTVEALKKKLMSSKKGFTKKIKTPLLISIKTIPEKLSSENVLAYIEGGDLRNELIVISAHYDHLGKDGAMIYNGADDDGSGTSAVLNLAKVFAMAKKEGHGPRRSILIIAFSGEEKGLLGSDYYVNHPEFPLKNTVCDLNIDMIGREDDKYKGNPNYIYVIGSDKLSSELHEINEYENKTYCNLQLDYTYNDEHEKNRYYYRSDHYNFAKNGIPVIFYFNGVHADYHKETDEVDKIDFNKMEKITRLVFYTAWEIANRDKRIAVDSNKK
ncbi:MAG TPA: M28 family peptidase [Bacteroidia bacterium]|jgi:hypothetical protein|nr:M28 family peptidase [Bacteroidia bacterium]